MPVNFAGFRVKGKLIRHSDREEFKGERIYASKPSPFFRAAPLRAARRLILIGQDCGFESHQSSSKNAASAETTLKQPPKESR
jgi:hypothetical protein